MHFLFIDSRFGTPIHVFLEVDPREAEDYPGMLVRSVTIEVAPAAGTARPELGRDPRRPDRFREFRSESAAAGAGFLLVEPRYVGATWEAYAQEFRPQGERFFKRAGTAARVARSADARVLPARGAT